MPRRKRDHAEPAGPAAGPAPSQAAPVRTPGPGVLTTLVCEQCGNEQLIRVKGCWYCEKCHYKFDCYGY